MASLAVIAVPEFSSVDAAWIATLRALHDPLHVQVAPHVTLRFPHDPPDASALVAGVAAVAATTPPLAVAFDRLGLMDDPHRPKYRHLVVALADSISASGFASLQDRLGGAPADTPHMTVCRFGAVYSAKALLRQTGGLAAPLCGSIAALDVLQIANGRIEPLSRHPLAG